ncbi:MAG: hypothetical protein GW854_01565 [Erythrobacter sp.]|nr:hypothetical protein [Erythrobacter sp.]
MSKRTAAQKREYAENGREADRVVKAVTTSFELQRQASREIANDDVRAWAKRSHTVTRAQERHGAVIDLFGLREIEERIKTGRTVQEGLLLLGHRSRDGLYRRTSIWLATFGSRVVPLVFDHDACAVTTALPMDAHHLEFIDGRFTGLVGGGTCAGRQYWSAIFG